MNWSKSPLVATVKTIVVYGIVLQISFGFRGVVEKIQTGFPNPLRDILFLSWPLSAWIWAFPFVLAIGSHLLGRQPIWLYLVVAIMFLVIVPVIAFDAGAFYFAMHGIPMFFASLGIWFFVRYFVRTDAA
jgi:hypothetical protein